MLNIRTRLSRLEGAQMGNALADLTDEELEIALADLKEEIKLETGCTDAELASYMAERMADGSIANDIGPEQAFQLAKSIIARVNGKTRSIGSTP